jgi:carboxylate-amine ligase
MTGNFSFGLEEEFFLINRESGQVIRKAPPAFLQLITERWPQQVTHEMLQSQIEIVSSVHTDISAALREMRRLRRDVDRISATYGLSIVATGTHPLTKWQDQHLTEKRRYRAIQDDLQMLTQRNMLCGLHVHVQVPELRRRVEMMNRAIPFLPAFLGLSASSPFWQGRRTGLFSYRPSAYDELPRTGLPPAFASDRAYRSYVSALVKAGVIPDASYIWWALRPSRRWPTVELRIADSCTRVQDSIAIATLFRCLVHRLFTDRDFSPKVDATGRAIAEENRWRVQRYGLESDMIDTASHQPVKFRDYITQLIDALQADATALGIPNMRSPIEKILDRGTSAMRQLTLYRRERQKSSQRQSALREVANWLAETTVS